MGEGKKQMWMNERTTSRAIVGHVGARRVARKAK